MAENNTNRFHIDTVDFTSDNYGTAQYLNNWPMLYILENGKNAYVGQTTNIVKRMSQHKQSTKKQIFKKAHFIYSDNLNQSVTFDYESKLISLMAADGKFVLTNQNIGLAGLDYYDRDFYDNQFNELWKELSNKHLVEHTIESLRQSELFKYSPYKDLSEEQRALVNEIIQNLKRSLDRKIVVNGMPGSGKTIASIYLFKMLREIPEFATLKIGMVVPPTALRETYKRVFKSINGLSIKDVLGPSDVANKKYDILLVDEAHRLKMRKNLSSYALYDNTCKSLGMDNSANQLDWILSQTRCAILFYDSNQIVFPAGLRIEKLVNSNPFDTRMLSYITLTSQMRCQGGIKYLVDVKELLNGKLNHKVSCDDYELKIIDKFADFEKLQNAKEEQTGLSRMIAGYAWKWISKNDVKNNTDNYDIEIEGIKKKWNSCVQGWVDNTEKIHEVGCIHSTQGYDLNYGFVILGKDIRYNPNTKQVYVDGSKYYDKYGKNGASIEELEEYIKNIYYVLMSRGIKGTYLYICDQELKKYISNYIDIVY